MRVYSIAFWVRRSHQSPRRSKTARDDDAAARVHVLASGLAPRGAEKSNEGVGGMVAEIAHFCNPASGPYILGHVQYGQQSVLIRSVLIRSSAYWIAVNGAAGGSIHGKPGCEMLHSASNLL